MLYGFNQEHARLLKRVARREGLRAATGTRVKYPKPLPDDAGPIARIGKPDANIAKGATGTVSIWAAVDGVAGTEADTLDNVTASALGAAVTSGKWVSLVYINNVWYVYPWEC